ncbi:MAG: hypothetical protein GC149_14530 [Gammaproteobacteria bacterium]|nr:hypothetical protein [Gammaproteobacteria bacterium]
MTSKNLTSRLHRAQSGAALVTSLVILLVLTVLGISAMKSSNLQENIVGNLRDHDLAIQAADSALTDAENQLSAATGALPMPNSTGTYGVILPRGQFPNIANSAYDTSGTWDGANNHTSSTSLQGLSSNPSYIIEFEQSVIDNLDPESKAKGKGRFYYRITARGLGTSNNSAVLLQEVYGIRHY